MQGKADPRRTVGGFGGRQCIVRQGTQTALDFPGQRIIAIHPTGKGQRRSPHDGDFVTISLGVGLGHLDIAERHGQAIAVFQTTGTTHPHRKTKFQGGDQANGAVCVGLPHTGVVVDIIKEGQVILT